MKTRCILHTEFVLAAVLFWTGCTPILGFTEESESKGKLVHVGLIWLKKPGENADRQRLVDALREFSREIPEVRSLSVGEAPPSNSLLVDSTFDLCFVLEFDDQAALERYSEHPVHQKAAEELFLPLSRKILFYDFVRK